MRMNARRKKRGAPRLSLWAWFAAVPLFGVMPDAVAGDLVPAFSPLWAAATALSLTLITAVRGSQR